MTFLYKHLKKLLTGMFILNVLICVSLFVFTLMPCHEDKNFYELFSGFWGNSIAPFLMAAVLPLVCFLSGYGIKKPYLIIFNPFLLFGFSLLCALPLSFEAAIKGFMSIGLGEQPISNYRFAYYAIIYVGEYGFLVNFVFSLFIVIILLFGAKKYKTE